MSWLINATLSDYRILGTLVSNSATINSHKLSENFGNSVVLINCQSVQIITVTEKQHGFYETATT